MPVFLAVCGRFALSYHEQTPYFNRGMSGDVVAHSAGDPVADVSGVF
ncbi:hypothetical protein J5N58_05850 [Rhizobium cremeum]|nr:hypothetical protein [Rhizobium cremeum]MCJ7999197.1 hypothetical protein [Rhizobium cremeum]